VRAAAIQRDGHQGDDRLHGARGAAQEYAQASHSGSYHSLRKASTTKPDQLRSPDVPMDELTQLHLPYGLRPG
jgi:hypothetical protein